MLLKVTNLSVDYRSMTGVTRAVDRVSLELDEGEVLGLVGESGSGKSTIGYAVMGYLPGTGHINSGTISFRNQAITRKDRQTRWKDIAMVYQGAMNALNPVLTVSKQIDEVLQIHTPLTRHQRKARLRELFEMVHIDPERTSDYPHEFSGGMRQRVLIAMALACNPSILIADEATSNLDAVTQNTIMSLFRDLNTRLGLSLILISHDLSLVSHYCHRVIILDSGRVVESGEPHMLFEASTHPYTRRLFDAFPRIKRS